jgi:signal recognition particle receptor subunit beta
MNEYKVLFTGPMGAGKTTAIGSISETPPVVTDVENNDSGHSKARTTVGLDFGTLMLDNGDRVRLFGTPGQQRFDFLWKILANNALGLIILIDNSRPDPISDLSNYLNGFAPCLETVPCAIGVGRLDTHAEPGLDDYIDFLSEHGFAFPVIDVDVRQRDDVALLLDILLAQIEVNRMDFQ